MGVQLDELPLWLPPAHGGNYWHIPRSAAQYPDDRVGVHFWCGAGRNYVGSHFPFEIEPTEMKCGTCVGRYLGYMRKAGQIFRPRDAWALPTRCPGDDWIPGTRNCHACGRRTNAARGWYRGGIAEHRPAPELAERLEPCPLHGWTRIAVRDGLFVCGAWRCVHQARAASE